MADRIPDDDELIEKLQAQISYYEQETKHPIKFNREQQKEIKLLKEIIADLNHQLTLVKKEEPAPHATNESNEIFVKENPLVKEKRSIKIKKTDDIPLEQIYK